MRPVLKPLLLIIVGILTAGSLFAQDVLTLDECIDLALKNRASIIRARGAEATASAARRSALGEFLPSISASYSYSRGEETDIEPPNADPNSFVLDSITLDTITVNGQTAVDANFFSSPTAFVDEQDIGPTKRYNIGGSISLVNVPNWFNYAAAGAAKARAELNVLASEQDLIYSVKVSYYAYLATEENLETQQEAVKRAEEQLKLIESRYELGSASKSDVLKQKVQYGNDRLGLLRARNGVTNAKADLAFTIGLDPSKDYAFDTTYITREYTETLDEAINFGLDHNPGLLAQHKTVDEAQHGVKAAYSLYLPTLGASADWTKLDGTVAFPRVQEYSSVSKTWGFRVSWNIFDGFFREERVANAKVFRNNARADLRDERNRTITAIKTAYLEIDRLREQKDVSAENVEAAEEDLRITEEKYRLGAATILDLLDAQVSLKEAQVQLIQAEFDLNLAIAQLENAMGKM